MKYLIGLLLGLYFATSVTFAQQKEQRIALVIGNSAYKASPLKNPVNDARDMANSLRGYGFTVIERNNLTVKQIGSTLREFRSKLTAGSVALVFYAGHGIQIKGENYLPAVDADIVGEEDVPNQSLSTRQLMDVLADAKSRMNLVFLDACRDNPFARSFRSSSRGLGRENAPSGTLISFATRPGSTAADGDGRNGLYTSVLLQQIKNTDQPIEQVLKKVVSGVKLASKGQQEPWMEGSIEGDFCFGNCKAILPSSLNTQPAISEELREDKFWEDAKLAGNKEAFQAYLDLYPSGRYSGLAKASITKLVPISNSPSTPPSQLLSPKEALIRAYVGKWTAGTTSCSANVMPEEFRVEGEYIVGEKSAGGKALLNYKIPFATAKYLGKINGFHQLAFTLTSLSNTGNTSIIEYTVESDFSTRRTLSTLVNDKWIAKDGIIISSSQRTTPWVRCN